MTPTPSRELVQVVTPTGGDVLATFLPLESSLGELIERLLAEDADSLQKVCGKQLGSEADVEQWAVQLVEQSTPNRDWSETELEELTARQGPLTWSTSPHSPRSLAPS